DYGIKSVFTNNRSTSVTLEKLGEMPMPIDLVVTLKDSTIINYNIPLRIMRGEKRNDQPQLKTIYAEDWPWTYPEYNLTLKHKMTDILLMEIDPSKRMADIDRTNNSFPKPEELQFPGKATN
ncbi:MAG: M1 family peptidase, partial [Bacteroidetes bacterium]|nr:M1 family peptidase [Bacteroidota bacterium]